jgi:transcriptional regulator with PAS, ATPase and Fis domain
MLELREEIARISTTEAKVLVTGESGVGKELVARAIHVGSRRVNNPYVAMNCAGMPETLLESELFGHVRGSFTGAYRDKAGKLELANSGTVFLDEVGEMTLRMQGLLLRFLETGELQKVGSDGPTGRVNVRVVAATNRDLRTLITEGKFREDLFYRLNVIAVHVPPLRERREDIPLLVEHFLTRFSAHTVRPHAALAVAGSARGAYVDTTPREIYRVEPLAMEALAEYPWPGNVRELENAIERIVIRTTGNVVTLDDLPPEITAPRDFSVRPKRERRRTIVDDLWKKVREDGESFWVAVYPLYMDRNITRENVRELVRRGLEEARGNYRVVAKLFNTDAGDYKRFLSFLRKHDCQLPFREFRQ